MKLRSIEYVGDKEQQCIRVSSKDKLYITDDNVPTLNSIVTATLSELGFFREAGKALALDTLVEMADGSCKLMKHVEVGDFVMSPTLGRGTEVVAIPWEGIDDAYEITLSDGKKVVCNAEHRWLVTYCDPMTQQVISKVVPTQFMIDHPEIEFDIPSI